MTPITTIVHFEVPIEGIDQFLSAWRESGDLMRKQPGLIGGVFHRCTDPNGPFQFINVARWESAEALEAALKAVRGDALERLGVKVSQSNYTEEFRY